MLAVAPERRGEGLGYLLVETATERARTQGVRTLYLVTDGAQGYFGEKLGFVPTDRKDVARGDRCHRRVSARPVEDRDLDEEGALSPCRSSRPIRLRADRMIAEQIAKDAGKILLEGWGTRPSYGFKSEDINIVTEFDKRSEAMVVDRLAAAFPHDSIVAEEGTSVERDAGGRVWYVDPFDGTTNFAHGFPLFSVSLGLTVNRRPVLGVVEAPAMGWTFAGTVTGGGSSWNGKPIAPSRVDRLGGALLVTGFPYARNPVQTNLPEWSAFTAAAQGTRRLARRRWTCASSRAVGSTATGSARCTRGISSAARRSCRARAGRCRIWTAATSTASAGGSSPATACCTSR